MFTGLIETTGHVEQVRRTPTGLRVQIVASSIADPFEIGESVAVNGVCLTAVEPSGARFSADISPETARVTTLATVGEGRRVNLERSLRANSRLGGHFVLGHVDGMGRITTLQQDGDNHWLEISLPRDLATQTVLKGSIAIDGISLTVAKLTMDRVGVQIVPFTWAHTTLADARIGDAVNIETDVIGKYVARLMAAHAETHR
jgi:riboflavin synthase